MAVRRTDIHTHDFISLQPTQTGLEPVTSAVTGRRSNQLSHWAIKGLYLQNFTQIFTNTKEVRFTSFIERPNDYFRFLYLRKMVISIPSFGIPKAGHFENFVFSVPFEIKSSARSRTASVNKFTSSLLSLPDRLSFLFGQALDRLVAVRFTHCCASTPVLST